MALVDRITGELESVVKAMADGIAHDPRAGLTSGVEATAQLWRDHGPVLRARRAVAAVEPAGQRGVERDGPALRRRQRGR